MTASRELFYDFTIDGARKGYYYVRWDDRRLLSYTRFLLPDSETFVNHFDLDLQGERVVACRHNGEAIDYSGFPDDHYPSSAYPLYLPRAIQSGSYSYVCLSEEAPPTAVGETVLSKTDDTVTERRDGKVVRRFFVAGTSIERIDWNGAWSTLWPTADDAVAGGPLEFALPL